MQLQDLKTKNSVISKQNKDMELKILDRKKEHWTMFQNSLKLMSQKIQQGDKPKKEQVQKL